MKTTKKVGRPRKTEFPMITCCIRVPIELRKFLQQQGNTNQFVINAIQNTPEYTMFSAGMQYEANKQSTAAL